MASPSAATIVSQTADESSPIMAYAPILWRMKGRDFASLFPQHSAKILSVRLDGPLAALTAQ